jgi:cytochrome P450
MKKVEEFFSKNFERTFLAKIHRITPHIQLANLCSFLFRLKQSCRRNNSSLPAHLWLIEHMHEFIQQRFIDLNQKKSVDDLLQLMIDAVHSEKDQLLPTELLSNVFVVLIAGYETTSTALGYCTYRLAIHQDIQDKLYEELTEHSWSSDTNSYDVIMSKLIYMDLFVREVLRMHPIAIQIVNRQCMENAHVAGYHIQEGSISY